ncbi:beta-ketoacyl-ACP synthase II [Acidiferrimicrobium sp. IK]|nr:beta-ketoacyl-ACP synthase II [Acidiferrimicrobium sp. IK]MCU4185890.1 beta-ketoacyl-ACP synthase II [Acidiferrimicrobium sp. IK]
MRSERRRVVVTGMGALSALGTSAEATWDAMVAGRSGVAPIAGFDASGLAVRIAAEVRGFDPVAHFGKRRARHLDRNVQLALAATAEAVDASKLDIAAAPERVGVIYGTGIGGLGSLTDGVGVLRDRGPEWVSPYTLPMTLANMAAGLIAMQHGATGYNSCTVTACAASAQAIGEGADQIRLGRADAMICGGCEAAVGEVGIAAFAAMKALSTRNDEPGRASRPFDSGRDGFVMGEAAATLVLEEREAALARGATILAEVAGYGSTADAHHITAPHPDGDGAVRAMEAALADAGLGPGDVGYVNAHGTSTPPNDRVEALALRRVFGPSGPPVSSTKSMTGHTLGAAGALEAIACIQAIRTGLLPPTINLDDVDAGCELDHVAHVARRASVAAALTNSFGFGGHNATLIFTQA